MKYPRNYKGFKIDVSYFDSMYIIEITLGTKLVWTTKTEIEPTKEKIQLAIEDCLLINEYDIKASAMKKLSKDNLLRKILNFRVCKKLVKEAKANGSYYAILCPHYSINIATNKLYQNEKIDAEQLQWDLDELSDYVGGFVSVSDYDDLVVDMTDEKEEQPKEVKVYALVELYLKTNLSSYDLIDELGNEMRFKFHNTEKIKVIDANWTHSFDFEIDTQNIQPIKN